MGSSLDHILKMGEDLRTLGKYEVDGGVPNARFPSEEQYDFPWLRLDRQADFLDAPVVSWGSQGRSKPIGTAIFYVDDMRFSQIFAHPEKLLATKCVTFVEPNTTITLQSPRAFVIGAIWARRWVSRYWQETGLRCLVDMHLPVEYQELNLLSVPAGWKAYATKGITSQLWAIDEQLELARQKAESNDVFFNVFGGGLKVKEYCSQLQVNWYPEFADIRKGKFTDDRAIKIPYTTKAKATVTQTVTG